MGEWPLPAFSSDPEDAGPAERRANAAAKVWGQLVDVVDPFAPRTAIYTTQVEGIVIETRSRDDAWRTALWPVDCPDEAVPYEEGTREPVSAAHLDAVAYVEEALGMTVRRPR